MPKTIEINGGFAIVDDDDYVELARYSWHTDSKGYAARSQNHGIVDGRKKIKTYKMHRQIMGLKSGGVVDHIDGNKLNNCRANLRIVTPSQNSMNKKPQANAISQYKGVTKCDRPKQWRSRIMIDGKHIALGYYYTQEEAAAAYDLAAVKYHGEYARPNGVLS